MKDQIYLVASSNLLSYSKNKGGTYILDALETTILGDPRAVILVYFDDFGFLFFLGLLAIARLPLLARHQ